MRERVNTANDNAIRNNYTIVKQLFIFISLTCKT